MKALHCLVSYYNNSPKSFSHIKQTYFDAPAGTDPVALDLASMGKGQAWVNGHHIGRYWTLVTPKDGCKPCDYRGPYDSDKCVFNCGKPTQTWYSSKLLTSVFRLYPRIHFFIHLAFIFHARSMEINFKPFLT